MQKATRPTLKVINQGRAIIGALEGGDMAIMRSAGRSSSVATSSPDGMFDAPCGKCEFEMDQASDE